MTAGRAAWRAGASIIAVATLTACSPQAPGTAPAPGADPGRGRELVRAVGCAVCHEIPGVRGPRGRIGPPLGGFADRALIAGQFPNTPDTLALWVREAPALSPATGMPPMPLDEAQARDVAAFLGTLRDD